MSETKTDHELTAAETAELHADLQQQPAHDVVIARSLEWGARCCRGSTSRRTVEPNLSVELDTGKSLIKSTLVVAGYFPR